MSKEESIDSVMSKEESINRCVNIRCYTKVGQGCVYLHFRPRV